MNGRNYITRTEHGYSLVELLVGLSVIGLLFGLGFANYRDFSRRQAISAAARQIGGDLRIAQEQALAGKKPTDVKCNTPNYLRGYKVSIFATSYVIDASCSGGDVNIKVVTLPSGISTDKNGQSILFKTLGQGTDLSSNLVITVSLTNVPGFSTQTITITSTGEIK